MPKYNPEPASPGAWAAFEAEAMPHADRLFRVAMWHERNRASAEDAVQEALLQALRSFHRFQPGTNCRAWLVTILLRVLSNRRRSAARSLIVTDENDTLAEATFTPQPAQHVTDEDMLAAIARLPVTFQDVLILADVEELSYKEIAEALTIPIGTVMSRLHRARALLRRELAPDQSLVTALHGRS